MKKQTIRFYTDSNEYMGWIYFNKTTYHNQILGWIRSGNYVKINNKNINWINRGYFYLNSHLFNILKGNNYV